MAAPDALGIVARNMAETLKFYRLLGLDIPASDDGEPHVDFVTPGGFRLMWDTEELAKSLTPDWVEPAGHRMGLAFKCENAAEVNTLYEQVVQNGYHGYKAPWDAFWGQRYAVVTDPNGNHVDLFAAL
ncbi:MAG: VOC family protein [Chloroflexota bacterium]